MNPEWIWTEAPLPARNAFVRFRRCFAYRGGGSVRLQVSADSHYWLYLNGEFLGSGPVRSWPEHWKYDEYEISSLLRAGENTVAVLVNHFGVSTFQYLHASPGLWVQMVAGEGEGGHCILKTDASWKCDLSPAHLSKVPGISIQQPFEEQYDARREDGWTGGGYADAAWAAALPVEPPHPVLEPRGIPLLTSEPVFPQRILRAECVRSPQAVWSLHLKPYYAPEDRTSNLSFLKGFVGTQVWSESGQTVEFVRPHYHDGAFKVNGQTMPGLLPDVPPQKQRQSVALRAGWNSLLFPYPGMERSADGVDRPKQMHMPQFVLAVHAAKPLRWAARGKAGGAAWAFVGPFAFTARESAELEQHGDFPRLVLPRTFHPEVSDAAFQTLLATGGADGGVAGAPYFQELREEDICTNDVMVLSLSEEAAGPHTIENAEALLSDNAEWAVIPPSRDGADVRVLLDFGREIIGSHLFEIDAAPGTILDFHNFEFIQADGRLNDAEGMNNSFRYVCRAGRQRFRSLVRRGFQYSWMIVRSLAVPLRIRTVQVEFSTYPQARRGSFACDDAMLNRIWETGAHTLRCCAEDTYTDCPSYEQVHWVGDARNEALIDWAINGDPRLWFRCLEQTAQSLERSPITLSQVPSGWENIIPVWSFLWMRSCREYLLWTGDYAGAAKLFPWVQRNVEGIAAHINRDGLFEIQAWNFFDWAEMDTPSTGVVTHNNCFAVLALNDCAQLAEWLGEQESAGRFRAMSQSLGCAINEKLWDAGREAYVDSLHADGVPSRVFSQQTQTVALISGVASGARAGRCREILHHPPAQFVKAGSPFFEFFLLEVLAGEGRENEFLDMIRKDWGFMVEQGATTFWEMWSLKTGRLTRSHCHGWSAAPTFFLSSIVMGIWPTKPGFAEVQIKPQLGNLKFVRGAMPTPYGLIEVSFERRGSELQTTVRLPKGVRLNPE